MDRRSFFKRTAGAAVAPFIFKWERPAVPAVPEPEPHVNIDVPVYDHEDFSEAVKGSSRLLNKNIFVTINGHDISDCVHNVCIESAPTLVDITSLDSAGGFRSSMPLPNHARCEIEMDITRLRAVEIGFDAGQFCKVQVGWDKRDPVCSFEGMVEFLTYESDLTVNRARVVIVGPIMMDQIKQRRICKGPNSRTRRNG